MSQAHKNFTFDLSSSQAEQLLAIQHRAVSLLGRLRVLRDGSVEVEDQWAGSALEALAGVARAGVPNQAILETETRSGMPWSVFIGHCLTWWEGSTQGANGASMCMPKNLNPSPESECAPQIKLKAQNQQMLSVANGQLEQQSEALSTWKPTRPEHEANVQDLIGLSEQFLSPPRSRPPTPYLPFVVVLIERLGSLDLFFKGLQWNKGRRVPMIKSNPPWWPIVFGALAAILLSGRSWWAPWPIMSIFGAGFGWLISQSLAQKEYCGGTACRQVISKSNRTCRRCGGDIVR